MIINPEDLSETERIKKVIQLLKLALAKCYDLLPEAERSAELLRDQSDPPSALH